VTHVVFPLRVLFEQSLQKIVWPWLEATEISTLLQVLHALGETPFRENNEDEDWRCHRPRKVVLEDFPK